MLCLGSKGHTVKKKFGSQPRLLTQKDKKYLFGEGIGQSLLRCFERNQGLVAQSSKL